MYDEKDDNGTILKSPVRFDLEAYMKDFVLLYRKMTVT